MTTGPALACPRPLLCFVEPSSAGVAELPRASTPAPIPDVHHVTLAPRERFTFEAPPKGDPNEIELPWIWRVLRDQFHAHMPKYEAQEAFTLALSPVVVTTPSDSIPGVGVAGAF